LDFEGKACFRDNLNTQALIERLSNLTGLWLIAADKQNDPFK
jgi:hypothetical protein